MSRKGKDRAYRHEIAIAEFFLGERSQRPHGEDVIHYRLSIECKTREKLPKWLHDWSDQAILSSDGTMIAPTLSANALDYMACRLADFVKTNSLITSDRINHSLPKWISDAEEQAHRNAGEDKIAVVITHHTGQRYDRDIVLIVVESMEAWAKHNADCQNLSASDV